MLFDVSNDGVKVFNVTKAERVGCKSNPRGTQIKWKHGNYFVKMNLLGYEDVAEVMVSYLLSFTNLLESEYVDYYSCVIYEDGKFLGNGCYSKDFVGDYTEVSVSDLLDASMLFYPISYDELREYLYDIVGFDVKGYLDKILSIDSITRNDDRHFKNILFLYKNGVYSCAPIFDNGSSCLSDIISYPFNTSFSENFQSVYAKPFKVRFESNLVDNIPLIIDYNSFISSISVNDAYSIRAFETIKRGLLETEGSAWVRKK